MSEEIKHRIIKVLSNQLNEKTESFSLSDNEPLFEYGLGVDSVSTLEMIVALENEFNIDIDESDINADVLYSISTLEDYIKNHL